MGENKEIKCFLCGATVDEEYNLNNKIYILSCSNPQCFMHSDTHPDVYWEMDRQFQSRINNEKELATSAERARCWDIVAAAQDVNEMLDKIYERETII